MRKSLIAAVAAFAGMSTTAHAADIYGGSLKDEPVAYTPAPIWTGFYVGGHIGGLWSDNGKTGASYLCGEHGECDGDWKPSEYAKFEDDDDDLSLLGGVHIGYNWQEGSRVYGLEGDLSFSDGVDYLASLRARLGHAWDDVFIYATAGVAFAGVDDKTVNVEWFGENKEITFSGDSEIGLVVGGGIERKLSSNVSVGLEGLYYFFDGSNSSNEAFFDTDCLDWCGKFDHEDDNDLFVVRARLSYSLQRDEPALDSYK